MFYVVILLYKSPYCTLTSGTVQGPGVTAALGGGARGGEPTVQLYQPTSWCSGVYVTGGPTPCNYLVPWMPRCLQCLPNSVGLKQFNTGTTPH